MECWRAESSKGKNLNLEMVQAILGLQEGSIARDDFELDGHFAYPADTSDFNPDDIEEKINPSRYEELSHGQKPTDSEVRLWAQTKNSSVFEGDSGWYHFYLWKIDLPDEKLFFRSLHGDGGIVNEFDGPFGSEVDALDGSGNLELNPRR